MNVLFNYRAGIGGFNETGSNPAGWYWSSSHYTDYDVWDQCFSDGGQDIGAKHHLSSLRLVR